MIVVVDCEQAEVDLTAGRLPCPRCGGRLRPWAHSGWRAVRMLDGSTRRLRPRRARCTVCAATQVLVPGWCLPRRGDATEVVGAALVAKARGLGWRRIATLLGRPESTVRAWLRHVGGCHLEWLRRRGVDYAAASDPQIPATIAATGSELGDALAALSAAVVAWRRRFAGQAELWTLIGAFTGGLLKRVPAD